MCWGTIGEVGIKGDPITENEVKKYGGSGYSFILEKFLPELRTWGVSEQHIQIDNGGEPEADTDVR